MTEKNCYIPGQVNIGSAEKKRRIRNGWSYLTISAILLVLIYFFDVPSLFILILYVTATLSALGFIQAYYSFCVYYGLKKEYRMDSEKGTVADEQQIATDKRTSINIIIVSLTIGFLVTLLAFLIS